MKWVIENLEEVPDDLEPGTYCARLISMTWAEAVVRFTMHRHEPGTACCLVQLVKQGTSLTPRGRQ